MEHLESGKDPGSPRESPQEDQASVNGWADQKELANDEDERLSTPDFLEYSGSDKTNNAPIDTGPTETLATASVHPDIPDVTDSSVGTAESFRSSHEDNDSALTGNIYSAQQSAYQSVDIPRNQLNPELLTLSEDQPSIFQPPPNTLDGLALEEPSYAENQEAESSDASGFDISSDGGGGTDQREVQKKSRYSPKEDYIIIRAREKGISYKDMLQFLDSPHERTFGAVQVHHSQALNSEKTKLAHLNEVEREELNKLFKRYFTGYRTKAARNLQAQNCLGESQARDIVDHYHNETLGDILKKREEIEKAATPKKKRSKQSQPKRRRKH